MVFRDLTDIIGPLELPINGVTYTLPKISAPDGARITAALAGETELSDEDLKRIVLGGVEADMTKNGVRPSDVSRVLWTALADIQSGRAVAELIWENGVDPKALTATTNRATRRKASAGANTTKRRASTNGTTKA